MFNLSNEQAQESNHPRHGCFIADIWNQFCEINIASPNTRPEESVSPSKSVTAADRKNIARLEEVVRLLKESPKEGREFFQQIYGADMAPDQKAGWSADSFEKMGLHPELGNPACHGHKTIKGVAFLDVDGTQSHDREWTPHSALDRALFIIECAQQGIAVVPVTGSPMSGGETGFSIDGRLENGELFKTHFLFTDGGAEGYALEDGQYRIINGYQEELAKKIEAYVGHWEQVHNLFVQVTNDVCAEYLVCDWAKNEDNLREFNERSIAVGRFTEEMQEIPFVTVQPYFPLDQAESYGRVNFYMNLPANEELRRTIINSVDNRFKEALKDQGIEGLTCFASPLHKFGVGEYVTQWAYDVGVINKQLSLRGLKRLEGEYGIPLDVFATLSFGGDSFNDPYFVPDFERVVKEQAPGLLSSHGVFLVQTGIEQNELGSKVLALGWPEERLIVLSKESHGTLWCERLRNGLREGFVLSD